MPRMRCRQCRQVFTSIRNDAVYCGAKCRVYANRAGETHEPDNLDPVPAAAPSKPLVNRRCEFCNHWFLPRRKDAVFCCTKCRVYASRARSSAEPAVAAKPTEVKAKPTVTVKRNKRNGKPSYPEFLYEVRTHGHDKVSWFIIHRVKVHCTRTGRLWFSEAGHAEVPVKQDYSLDWDKLIETYILTGDTFDQLQFPPVTEEKVRCTFGSHVTCRNGEWRGEFGGTFSTERQLRNQWDRKDTKDWKPRRERAARHKRQSYQTDNQHWLFKSNIKRDTSLREDLFGIFESYGNILSDDGGKAFEKTKLSGDELEAALACLDDLGLDETATDRHIKSAYRRKAIEHHPDHGGTATAFKRVKSAYGKLTGDVLLLKRKKR